MRLEPGAALPLLASHMGWPGLLQDTAPRSFLLLLRSPHDPPAWDNVGTCALHPRAGRCTLVQHCHVQSRALNGLSAGTPSVNQEGCPVPDQPQQQLPPAAAGTYQEHVHLLAKAPVPGMKREQGPACLATAGCQGCTAWQWEAQGGAVVPLGSQYCFFYPLTCLSLDRAAEFAN